MQMKMYNTVSASVLVVLVFGIFGCSGKQTEAPRSGEPLRQHLLGIIRARNKAYLDCDMARARSYYHPYINAEEKTFQELMGILWDNATLRKALKSVRSLPSLFSGDTKIEMKLSGDWAYLRQVMKPDMASKAYFRLTDGKWRIVNASFGDPKSDGVDHGKFAHLVAETYWPDNMDDFFFLPPIQLEAKTSNQPPKHMIYNWRISLHVTNTSDKTISARAMMRRFTHIQHVLGKSQSATKIIGGDKRGDLKPGEVFYIGDVEVSKPKDPKETITFYVGPYVSNRLSAQ